MGRAIVGFFVVMSLATMGCGSDDGEGGGTGGTSSGGTGGAAGTTGSGALLAPEIEMVMPMAPAGLHVSWMNKQDDCDSVDAERKTATVDFAEIFSVPGYVDNEHDETASEKLEYTYRLRCKKGGAYSPYSNEMGGTPE